MCLHGDCHSGKYDSGFHFREFWMISRVVEPEVRHVGSFQMTGNKTNSISCLIMVCIFPHSGIFVFIHLLFIIFD